MKINKLKYFSSSLLFYCLVFSQIGITADKPSAASTVETKQHQDESVLGKRKRESSSTKASAEESPAKRKKEEPFSRIFALPHEDIFWKFLGSSKQPPRFPSLYLHAETILSLADGKDEHDSLAMDLRKQYPRKTIFRSDIRVTEDETKEDPFSIKLDHQKPFPLPSNQFDFIVMKRGICHCFHPDLTCGGITIKTPQQFSFMEEVVRVLNKNEPSSAAFLQGVEHNGDEKGKTEIAKTAEQSWEKVLSSLKQKYPDLKFQMVYNLKDPFKNDLRQYKSDNKENQYDTLLGRINAREPAFFKFLGIYITIQNRESSDSTDE